MITKYFRGLRVYIPLQQNDVAAELRGCTIRIVSPISPRSRVHTTLGMAHLDWMGKVIRAPKESSVGKVVYINNLVGIPLEYDGDGPAHIDMKELLRTCHADPKAILGNDGS